MTDTTTRMRQYLTRLAQSHAKAFAKVLARRDAATLADVPNDELFALGEQLRAEAGLPTAYILASARGLSLEADPFEDEVEDQPANTAQAINQMAVELYRKSDGEPSLIDAVPPGSSTRDAIGYMAQAAKTLRERSL